MMSEKKELSQLGRQLLGQSAAVTLFTEEEFDQALAEAYDKIMKNAINATKLALIIERDECAKIIEASYETTKPNEPISADWLLTLAEAIRNRIPEQRH
jgi:hypothetical protein